MSLACVLLAGALLIGRALPEGGQIAFQTNIAGGEDILIADVRTALVFNLTAAQVGNETSPSWSPDGRMLAYEYANPGTRAVSGVDLMTSTGRRLGRIYHGTASQPQWSPDGLKISVTVGQTVQIVNVAATAVQVQVPDDASDYYSAHGLWQRLRTQQTALLPGRIGGIMDARWSPDRSWISFTFWDGTVTHLYRVPGQCLVSCDQTALLLPIPSQGRGVALSSRGEFAVYECQILDRSGLCVMRVDGSELRPLITVPRGVRIIAPEWRP